MSQSLGREELTAHFRSHAPVVLPSLLLCDFGNFQQEIQRVEAAGVRALHLDVMDGRFVPNLTYGMPIVEAARRATNLPLDVHLMIVEPAKYIDQFRKAGADVITIHAEAVEDPRPVLDQIRATGALAGLALNPSTPLASIEASLPHADMVLVMSVMPGFGGQQFDQTALDKLRELHNRTDLDLLLEVDGGISTQTIGACAEAGAELFVAGSAIFCADDLDQAVNQLHALANSGVGA